MTRLTSTKAYAHLAGIALVAAFAAGCAEIGNPNPTAPSLAGSDAILGSGGSATLSGKPAAAGAQTTTVGFSGFDAAALTVNVETTTAASVGQPYISQGKIQLEILVDSTGKAVPCLTPGATYVRFDTDGGGGANPNAAGVTSTLVDLDNLATTTSGAVQNIRCGDKICIRAHYVTGGGSTKVDTHFSTDTPFDVVCNIVCTLGQGYWKNHYPTEWPASVVGAGLTLGSVSYTAAQLQSIFGVPPATNGLIALAHQLIAAKLNVANGADGTAVASSIAAADALIGSLIVPPVGGGSLAPSLTSALTQALDDYNSGVTGPGACPD